MKLLLIEDDTRMSDFIQRGLKEHSHAVDHAENGKDRLFLAANGKYDAAIVDHMLPELPNQAPLNMGALPWWPSGTNSWP